ncbi:ribosomal protein P2 [Trichoderma parareesei]|uniref:Ribosomal protein P2 n=1 Tax=Trichoderma parareesei TaxID=858221 RepID=A0A2H2ZUI9_TRIPA|nr:ribosomal protein P2 [Trichoderma parareesei]
MPSQRPFFLSSFFNSFRQQAPSLTQQASKHSSQAASASAAAAAAASTTAAAAAAAASASSSGASSAARAISTSAAAATTTTATTATTSPSSTNVAIHTPRGSPGGAIPIPHGSRRRGSDSSSEGFRDALGADKWYIGGRTAAGEEKFFKLGVIRRVRSNDGLSLDRLSL